ncbi:hypothetical protein ACLBXM_18010 [Xanthobacteraceae bacterium A53D]
MGVIASAPAHGEPISASIVAAIGFTGTAATIATGVGTFLIGTAVSVGLSYLSRAFTKNPGSSAASNPITLELSIDADRPRTLILGTRAVGGSLHYHCKSGPQGENIDLIILLADHECNRLAHVWVNDRAIAMNMNAFGYQEVGEFRDKHGIPMMSFRFYRGTLDQLADPTAMSGSGGQWTANHRLLGCAYVHVRIVFNPDVWGSSLPTLKWLVEGAKLYDPRLDSTMPGGSGPMRWGQPSTYQYADNLEIARYNFLRGIYVNGDKWFGVGLTHEQASLGSTYAAIAACAEPVLRRDGYVEPRYRVAAVIEADEPWRDVLNKFSLACAGNLPDLSGSYVLMPGVAQVPVLAFTDLDLIPGAEITGSSHRPFDELVSEVTGSWASPEVGYDIAALPARYSSVDEAADGGFRRSASIDLSYVASQSQGQRCMEIVRRLARRQITHKVTLRRRFCVLEAGDWVWWSSDKYGYVDRVFRVEAVHSADDLTVTLQLREIDADVYAWSVSDEMDPGNPVDLPAGGPGAVVVTNLDVATAQVNGIDGTQVPGLRVTWDPISDLTVYALLLEYRRLGDVPWQTYQTSEEQVRAGGATVTAGVLGGEHYQARATPLTSPRRVVDTSAPATTDTTTVEVIVNRAVVSTITEAVRPDTITNDALAAITRQQFDQAREALDDASVQGFLEQVTRHNAVEGLKRDGNLLAANIEQVKLISTENGVALANLRTTLTAERGERIAAVQAEQTARVDGDAASVSHAETLVAQEATDRGAAISTERNARISGDAVSAGRIDTLVTQVGDNAAAISDEREARIDALGAMTTSINTATARANGASANGQWGVVAQAGINGASSSYVVRLNAGAITTGFRLDAMSGGTSRAVFSTGAFVVEDTSSGTIGSVFSYSGGAFQLTGNVRINGNLLITGSIGSDQISETSGISTMVQMFGSRTSSNVNVDWVDVQSPVSLTVPTRGGFSQPLCMLRGVLLATQSGVSGSSRTTGQVRVLCNGTVVYGPVVVGDIALGGAGLTGSSDLNDFFQFSVASGGLTFQLQVKMDVLNQTSTLSAKIGIMNGGR